jgi:LAGLIDADG endonuclease
MQIRKFTSLGKYSNLLGGKPLHPDWISGFIDGEGCFNISVTKNPKMKVGYNVQLKMHVTQHVKSVNVLYAMKEFFGCGSMVVHNKLADRMRYQITAIADLQQALIPFLEEHPLLTSKFLNYLDFKTAVDLVSNKKHLTLEGIELLRILAKGMNTGRTFDQKWVFCQENSLKGLITPGWFAGFVDGEGCFSFHIDETKSIFKPSFQVTQNSHDIWVLKMIQEYLDCGVLVPRLEEITMEEAKTVSSISHYRVYRESDLLNTIIPFFDQNPLLTTKGLDFSDWKALIHLKRDGAHLTELGKNQMFSIKSGMNRGRE